MGDVSGWLAQMVLFPTDAAKYDARSTGALIFLLDFAAAASAAGSPNEAIAKSLSSQDPSTATPK